MTTQGLLGLGAAVVAMAGAFFVSENIVSRQADPAKVTVVYWEKWTGSEGTEMQKVVKAFNASQNRIFVKYLSISGIDSKTLLATSGGNPPDVAGIWADQLCQFADAGALMDLTDIAKKAGLDENYYIKSYWDSLVYRGGLWGLPSTPASLALHVRTDLVPAQYATPETFPKTIEDFDKLMFEISKKDGNHLKMAGFLPSDPGWWNWAWGLFFGGKLVDGDKLTINSPENVRGFEWVAKYSKQFGAAEVQSFQAGFGNFASPNDPFMVGKEAVQLNGVWKANYVDDYAKTPFKWFAVPFPYPKDRPDLAGHSDMSQDVLTIPRGAKHAEAAFEFIRYVQRQDVMEGLCAGHGKNSPLQKVSEHFFQTHKNPYIRLFDALARSPKAFAPPQIGIWPQIRDEVNVAFQEVTTDQKTSKQALDDAQARLEGLWKTYQAQVLAK